MYLFRFDFTLKYVPDTKMEKADRLSKRSDWKVGVEKNNENQTLIEEPKVEIVEKIKKARSKDKEVFRVVEEIKKAGNKWQMEEDLVLKEEKVYVLKNEELRVEIIWLHHNVLVAEHKGK